MNFRYFLLMTMYLLVVNVPPNTSTLTDQGLLAHLNINNDSVLGLCNHHEPWFCHLTQTFNHKRINHNNVTSLPNDILLSLYNLTETMDISMRLFITYGLCHGVYGLYILRLPGEQGQNVSCGFISVGLKITNDILVHLNVLRNLNVRLPKDVLHDFLSIADMEEALKYNFFRIIGISESELSILHKKFPYMNIEALGTKTSAHLIDTIVYQMDTFQRNAEPWNIAKPTLTEQKDKDTWRYISSRRLSFANQGKRRLRVTTTMYAPYVYQMDSAFYPHCGSGQRCDVPVRNTNNTETLSWTKTCCSGMSIEILQVLSSRLGFDYDLYAVEDGKFGSVDEHGNWNGMVNDLVLDKADLAVNVISIVQGRAEVVEFTNHYIETSFGIIRKSEQRKEFPSWEFLDPLTVQLEIVIMATTLFTIFVISILENVGYWLKYQKKFFSTQELMTYIFGLTFQRDMGGTNPRMWSGRLAALGYASAMTVIMSVYTARITANSIKQLADDGFKGFADEKFQNPTEDYKFTLTGNKGYSQELYFQKHASETYRRMLKFMKQYFVDSDKEGLAHLMDGKIDAFVTELGTFKGAMPGLLAELGCSKAVEIYPKSIGQHGIGFAYNKNFPYGKVISNAIDSMRDNGEFELLESKWYPAAPCQSVPTAEQFEWTYFSGIVIILCVTFAIGIVINSIEHIFVWIKKHLFNKKT